jgi:hypothetical protein
LQLCSHVAEVAFQDFATHLLVKLPTPTCDLVLCLLCDTAGNVEVRHPLRLKPKGHSRHFTLRRCEDRAISVIRCDATLSSVLGNLLQRWWCELVNRANIARGEFLSTFDKRCHHIRWCTHQQLRIKPIDFADTWYRVAH